MKIAFLQIHEAPYRDDFLYYLNRQDGVELSVFSYKKSDEYHTYWGLEQQEPVAKWLGRHLRLGSSLLHFKLLNPFFLRRFDMVAVTAHSNMTSLLAYLWCWVWGVPYVYMADTVTERIRCRPAYHFKAAIYKKAAFIFVPGVVSRQFFIERYGIVDKKILLGYYSFSYSKIRGWAEVGREEREAIRSKLGMAEGERLAIMAANFLSFRDHLGLIKVFAKREEWHLLLIGEGPTLIKCKRYVEVNGLSDYIHFMKGQKFKTLIAILTAGDEYVHSGKEPFSTMPLLARLCGVKLGEHGDIPSWKDLESGSLPGYLDAEEVARRFAVAARMVEPKNVN
ncbi:MAG: glycosyltransferase family 4 protein [Lentisphaerae bacterium]|mgnify:CR=1 FL=1|nr:glycosyltransferase family 4 protein [Lentisphaerota bacterium]